MQSIDPSVWLAPGVQVYGRVAIAEHASLWPHAVIRAEAQSGKIKNLTDILKPRKENKAYESFFGITKAKGANHIQGDLDTGELFTRDQLNALTKEQLLDPKIMEKADKSYAILKN